MIKVLETVDDGLVVPYRVTDRLDRAKASDAQIRRFYKKDTELQSSAVSSVTPAVLYTRAQGKVNKRFNRGRVAGPCRLTPGEQDRLLLDQKIVEAFEGMHNPASHVCTNNH